MLPRLKGDSIARKVLWMLKSTNNIYYTEYILRTCALVLMKGIVWTLNVMELHLFGGLNSDSYISERPLAWKYVNFSP